MVVVGPGWLLGLAEKPEEGGEPAPARRLAGRRRAAVEAPVRGQELVVCLRMVLAVGWPWDGVGDAPSHGRWSPRPGPHRGGCGCSEGARAAPFAAAGGSDVGGSGAGALSRAGGDGSRLLALSLSRAVGKFWFMASRMALNMREPLQVDGRLWARKGRGRRGWAGAGGGVPGLLCPLGSGGWAAAGWRVRQWSGPRGWVVGGAGRASAGRRPACCRVVRCGGDVDTGPPAGGVAVRRRGRRRAWAGWATPRS
ncbi:hypothetical protein HD597_000109 [Nonomuraea thailandensis]|uniref:Uncharacterized protein n=1 Tax=Nonomuraea thailandensis TaxID=1188745 RepID=A0A9X2G953_9ACTN|nr:hypothetical protein [Nonomuraea thailandensis]